MPALRKFRIAFQDDAEKFYGIGVIIFFKGLKSFLIEFIILKIAFLFHILYCKEKGANCQISKIAVGFKL